MSFRGGARRVVLPVFTLFFLVGSLLTISGVRDLAGAMRLRREGQTIDAVIVNKDIRRVNRQGRSRAEHTLRYRFEAAGVAAEGRAVVAADEWERRQPGDRVAVRYLPQAPDVNRLADGKELESPIVSLALGGGIGSLFGALLGRQLFRIRLERRIRREGVPAAATVLAVEETRFRVKRVRQWRIRYRYQDHLGQAREGDTGAVPPADVEGWKAGDPAQVRFDRARPRDSVWIGR